MIYEAYLTILIEMTPAINNTAVIPFVVAYIVKKKEVQHHNQNL
jgi:hypothetical protein